MLAYVLLVIVVAIGPGGGRGWRHQLWTLAVLPTMHVSWGLGFIAGVLGGAHDTVDTSAREQRRRRSDEPAHERVLEVEDGREAQRGQ